MQLPYAQVHIVLVLFKAKLPFIEDVLTQADPQLQNVTKDYEMDMSFLCSHF